MALTLTVEDGSIVTGANSYATLDNIRAYNAQRGVVLPTDDDAVIELATKALDYIEQYEQRFRGNRAVPLLQELSWPRVNVWLYGSRYTGDPMFSASSIPKQLVFAQSYLTGVALTIDLAHVQDTRAIIKEVIGPIETDYDPKTGATLRPIIPQLDSMLKPLLTTGSSLLNSVRI